MTKQSRVQAQLCLQMDQDRPMRQFDPILETRKTINRNRLNITAPVVARKKKTHQTPIHAPKP